MRQMVARAQRLDPAPEPSQSYQWEVAGKPVVVRLSLELIDQMEREVVQNFRWLNSPGSEVGGVLWGSVQNGSPLKVSVEDYDLVPCDYSKGPLYRLTEAEVEQFGQTIGQRCRDNGLRLTGFFRSHTRRGMRLDAEDLKFFQGQFREPHQFALLIRPHANKPSTAGIFIWENGTVQGDVSHLEFPFRRSELERMARTEQQPFESGFTGTDLPEHATSNSPARGQIVSIVSRHEIGRPPSRQDTPVTDPIELSEPVTAPVPMNPPSEGALSTSKIPGSGTPRQESQNLEQPRPSGLSWALRRNGPRPGRRAWIAGSCAAALLLVGGMLGYPGLAHNSRKATVPENNSGLSLRVERSAGGLLLSWNRDSDRIQHAAGAMLSIADGDKRETLDLGVAELRNGAILYTPLSADVIFVLSVKEKYTAKVRSESVRILSSHPLSVRESSPTGSAPPQPRGTNSSVTNSNNHPAGDAADANDPRPDLPKNKPGAKVFHSEALIQLVGSARPSDLPEAPRLTGIEQASVPPGVTFVPLGITLPSAFLPDSPRTAGARVRPAELASRTDPQYPPAARRSKVEGTVLITATIGTDGHVKSAKVISGPSLLRGTAIAAVKQWSYRPAQVNGSPVEVETPIEFRFRLEQ